MDNSFILALILIAIVVMAVLHILKPFGGDESSADTQSDQHNRRKHNDDGRFSITFGDGDGDGGGGD